MRDYGDFVRRLHGLSLPNLQQDTLGEVDGYAFYRLLFGAASRVKRQVLITAGLHGDEAGGARSGSAVLAPI